MPATTTDTGKTVMYTFAPDADVYVHREAVDFRKQQKVRKAAFRWLTRQPWHERVRFDVAVVLRGQVRIIEDAF